MHQDSVGLSAGVSDPAWVASSRVPCPQVRSFPAQCAGLDQGTVSRHDQGNYTDYV